MWGNQCRGGVVGQGLAPLQGRTPSVCSGAEVDLSAGRVSAMGKEYVTLYYITKISGPAHYMS